MLCVKSVQIRIFFWSVFSRIGTPYPPVLNPNAQKYEPEKTLHLFTFHAVMIFLNHHP